ncbi:MAG: hypothetical protein A2551_07105 [Elusimicrobia bacterium RIFOXYD2_FULL_34_30]|nr:MAG: hypothetical protein A2551_07105 [Elusimicrobia bacterium RIFOXYD2_FULL_34_30]
MTISSNEKRKIKRFPVLYHLVKPVLIVREGKSQEPELPAIMANLSAGGMALVTFSPLSIGEKLIISFKLKDIQMENVKAKIVRCENKGGACIIGIQFEEIDKKLADKLCKMADDFDACRTRLLTGEKNACKKDCSYYAHCHFFEKKK